LNFSPIACPPYTTTCSVASLPKASFTSSDTTFCNEAGMCIDFYDHSFGSPVSWQWSFPGAIPNSSTQQNPLNICYTQPGTYPVTLIVSNSAGTDTLRVSPLIIFGQTPPVPTINVSHDTLTSSHAFSYQWYFNGSPVGGAKDSFYVALLSGVYSVRITDSLGCGVVSNGVTITVTSINEVIKMSDIEIFPNPSKGIFEIIINANSAFSTTVEIIDALGQTVYNKTYRLTKGKNRIEVVAALAEGIYQLKVNEDGRMMKREISVAK
jgi:PKD repeat protein